MALFLYRRAINKLVHTIVVDAEHATYYNKHESCKKCDANFDYLRIALIARR